MCIPYKVHSLNEQFSNKHFFDKEEKKASRESDVLHIYCPIAGTKTDNTSEAHSS